jgi:hypothetical protein
MLVVWKRVDSIHFWHELLMNSFLGEALKHFIFSFSLECDSSSNHWSNFLLSSSGLSCLISISFSNYFCCLSLRLLNDLSFNESCLSCYLIKFQFRFSIDLTNKCISISLPFTLNSFGLSNDSLNILFFL